ncbi:MAG: SURF1 family protein [Acidimicrobiales bacterium]|nr:SURF1 family protein [Acidimicrobiales bacterium]
MYRFLLSPRWIVTHVLMLILVGVLVTLGLWQLHRLDQRRDFNALVRARTEVPAAPVDEVLPADAGFAEAEGVVFRTVTASGTYAPDEQVVVRSRSFEGKSGAWLLTPLRLGDGTAVLVNRGWVPLQAGIGLEPAWAPPSGTVQVEGLLVATQTRGRFGAIDPEGERLETVARADVARLQEQVDEDLLPAVLQLAEQDPAQPGDFPVAIGAPELSEGPHLNYAGQWFIYATIAAVGYPLMLRRMAQSRAREAAADAAAAGDVEDEGDRSGAAPIEGVGEPVDAPA